MGTSRPRWLEITEVNDVTTVRFTEQRIVQDRNIQEMGQELIGLVEHGGVRKLILNFSGVNFLVSTALGKLITVNRKMEQKGGKVIMCELNPEVRDVFKVANLDQYFTIVRDQRTALEAFASS